jgi:hypothetical protein
MRTLKKSDVYTHKKDKEKNKIKGPQLLKNSEEIHKDYKIELKKVESY